MMIQLKMPSVQPHPVSAPSLKVTKAVDLGHRAWVWLSSDSGAQ